MAGSKKDPKRSADDGAAAIENQEERLAALAGGNQPVNGRSAVEEKPAQKAKPVIDSDYTLEIVKDFDGAIDLFYLNKSDPNFYYRWLKRKDENLAMKTTALRLNSQGEIPVSQVGGWQIVPRNHLLRMGICSEKELQPDGTYMRGGEMVLAFMPKDLWEKKKAFKQKEAEAPMRQVKRLLNEGDPSVGSDIKAGDKRLKGLQTREALGMS